MGPLVVVQEWETKVLNWTARRTNAGAESGTSRARKNEHEKQTQGKLKVRDWIRKSILTLTMSSDDSYLFHVIDRDK